jgi:hypothetical protein
MDFLGFWTLSIARYFKEHTTFRKLDLFSSSGVKRGGGKTPTQLGPLERPNLNHWISFPFFLSLSLKIYTGTLKLGLSLKVEAYNAPEDQQLLAFAKFADIGTNGKENTLVIRLGITSRNVMYSLWLRLVYLGKFNAVGACYCVHFMEKKTLVTQATISLLIRQVWGSLNFNKFTTI